jgi:uncharacterized protein (DUF849 family)
MMKPFIVMCAPNGARRSQADHAALPITADELADCAESILAAGTSIMHLHVRDDAGRHSLDADRYRHAMNAIRDRVGDQLVIQVTTEACGMYRTDEQISVVRSLKPESVSLALREFCPSRDAEPAAGEFFSWLKSEGIMAQYIIYSPAEALQFKRLQSAGIIPDERPFVLVVLGRYGDNHAGTPGELEQFTTVVGENTEWAVCCFGQAEQSAVALASAMNGHARVGFENNLLLPDGGIAADNAALVRLAANCRADRPLASAADVRKMFL